MSQLKVLVTGAAGSTGCDVVRLRALVRQVDERSREEAHEEAGSGCC